MSFVNKVSFSGTVDQVRKPFIGSGEGKKPFARVQLIQKFSIDENGETHEVTRRQMVKIFGKAPVDALKAAIEKGEETVVAVEGRIASEKVNGEQRIYKKKGSDEEVRVDLYETIVIVDEDDKAHGVSVVEEKKSKKAA